MHTRKSMLKQAEKLDNSKETTILKTNLKESSHLIKSHEIKKLIITANMHREEELRVKENYLNHLKSIDISKFSYPNEFKPPTDYTYAHTSSYLSSCTDNDNWEMPNLRRRSRHPINRTYSFASITKFKELFIKIIVNTQLNLNVFRKFRSIFQKTHKENVRLDFISNRDDLIFKVPQIPKIYINESTNIQTLTNNQKRSNFMKFIFILSILFLIISISLVLLALSQSQYDKFNPLSSLRDFNNVVQNNFITPLCSNSKELVNYSINCLLNCIYFIGNKFLTLCGQISHLTFFTFYDISSLVISFVRETFYFLYLLPFKLSLGYAEKNFNIDKFKTKEEYSRPWFGEINADLNEKILNDINSLKEKLSSEVIQNLENYKSSQKLVDINLLRFELDEKFNYTLYYVSSQLNDHAKQIELSKTAYQKELKQMQSFLEVFESKYTFTLNKLQEQLLKQKKMLDEQQQHQELKIEQQQQKMKETLMQNPLKVSMENEYISFRMVEEYINRTLYVYNADKTGMTDFASESVGGSILFTRCTEPYQDNSRWFTVFDVPITRVSVSPRVVIQGSIQPGNCWAFKGSKGDLFIKLAAKITPNSFSLEHIPRELSLTGSIDSAPQNFTVYGYENKDDISDDNRILLGNYRYDNNSKYNLQFFQVQHECTEKPISAVELKIESNAGNKDYTCIYKFRVHGKLFSKRNENENKQN